MKKKFSRLLATLLAVLLLMGVLPILPHAEEGDAEAYVVLLLYHTLPGGRVFNFGYEYNDGKNGNNLAITQDGLRHEYGYDGIGQLTQDKAIVTKTVTETAEVTEEITDEETGEVITEVSTEVTETQVTEETVTSYTYDIGGNLKKVTEKIGDNAAVITKEFEYGGGTENPGWMDQLTKVNGQTLLYDEIGNLFKDGASTYYWQKGSQLKEIAGAVNAKYTYDYSGLRKSKTTGGVTTEFIWAGGLLMAQIGSDGNTIAWHYDQGGKMMGFEHNSIPYFYLRNLQGDIIGIYDSAGTVVVNYAYDAWGNLEAVTGPLAGTLGYVNPIRYRGYYYDNETGFYYCMSRYYNPGWCRWISADGLMDTQDGIMGTNMYAYCLNEPVNSMDSTGMWNYVIHYGNSTKFAGEWYIKNKEGKKVLYSTNEDEGTLFWAVSAGMADEHAKIVAMANQKTDRSFFGPVPPWGWQMHFDANGATKTSQYYFDKAVDKWGDGTNERDKKAALQLLGKGLHSLQDVEAHSSWKVGLGKGRNGLGQHTAWSTQGTTPETLWFDDRRYDIRLSGGRFIYENMIDKTLNPRYNRTYEATRKALEDFIRRTNYPVVF